MECVKCGKAGRPVEASVMGSDYVTLGHTCEECWAKALDGHSAWAAEFERLLRGGMHREDANAELCRRIRAGEPPPVLMN